MKNLFFFFVAQLMFGSALFAQVGINTDNSAPNSSAMLDVKSSDKGVLIPRITFEQRNAIVSPAEGLMVFCLDCGTKGSLSIYSGGSWNTFSPCASVTPVAGAHVALPDQITWNWNESPGATGYKWNTTNNYGSATDIGLTTTKTETGLACNTSYTRHLWAYYPCGTSSPATFIKSTLSFPSPPVAGTHVPSASQVTWNWNTTPGVAGYKWNTTNNFNTATDIGLVTTKTETGLACSTPYTRYIWAYNVCGNSASATFAQTTLANPDPPAEGGHVAAVNMIVWQWDAVPGATGYKWNITNDYNTATNMGTGLFLVENGLACNTAYTRYVWAYNACGNSISAALNQSTLTDPPAAPTAGTHVPSYEQIIWNWNTVSGATGYKWNTTDDYATATDMLTETTKTETGLACNTPYDRYVWAYSACGVSTAATLAQTTSVCFTCGASITINHTAGVVAPVTKTVTYGTVANIPGETSKCWITSNLGADHQATAVNDDTEASAGWYWQFNRKQGYKHDGTARTPNTTWISSIAETSDWLPANDPCAIELGNGWRLPVYSEWYNVDNIGNWTNWNGPWNSGLKLHAAGYLNGSDGSLYDRGSYGYYWSSVQNYATYGWFLAFYSGGSSMGSYGGKAYGFALRCVRDY